MPTESESRSLTERLAELSSRPVADTRLDRARTRALDLAHARRHGGRSNPSRRSVEDVQARRVHRRQRPRRGVAYRIFVWLLPFALVAVLGLALVERTEGKSRRLCATPVSRASSPAGRGCGGGHAGWALAVGLVAAAPSSLPVAALLRAFRAVPRRLGLPVTRVPSPARSALLFLCWLVVFIAVASSAAPIRRGLAFPLDLVVNLAAYGAGLPLLWLLLSWFLLPHDAARWTELVPGAVVVGVGVAGISLFNSLILFPWLAEREETYGVLGVAAGLLFGFFLIGRTIELSAALNATLVEDRRRTVPR